MIQLVKLNIKCLLSSS